MAKRVTHKHDGIAVLVFSTVFAAILAYMKVDFAVYWIFGVVFGFIMQKFFICFVSGMSDPFITGSTDRFRAMLAGILLASLGATAIKYLSGGIFYMSAVSAISIPLVIGAFIFGIGMVLAGTCASGVFVRISEGNLIHIVTLVSIFAGYLFAGTHYSSVWSRFIANAPLVFLPEKLGWVGGVAANIAIILILFFFARKWESRITPLENPIYLKGFLLLALVFIIHFLVTKDTWSITGAYYWVSEFIQNGFDLDNANNDAFIRAVSVNLQNFGLIAGAFSSALFSRSFKLRKIRSKKQVGQSIAGGLLMGYGAFIAGGCNISALFVGAACLSLSAWVFLVFLLAGTFVGIKILSRS